MPTGVTDPGYKRLTSYKRKALLDKLDVLLPL